MKELSIEEKAKAYDDAIERAKKWYNAPNSDKMPTYANRVIEEIFPELCESEDEKTERILHSISSKMSLHLCDIFTEEEFQYFDTWSNTWLEKQGEPFDDNIITRDDEILQAISIGLTDAKEDLGWSDFGGIPIEEIQNWLEKQGNPTDEDMKEALRTEYEKGRADAIAEMQVAWSEEDEVMIANIRDDLFCYQTKVRDEDYQLAEDIEKEINWLKSFKERYTWKPSDDQMKALADALSLAKNCGEENAFDLGTLYEQLKKLKGE